jgi:hypothetical protein
MQFPLHLPCASMGVSLRTSMGWSFDCIEVADNRIVASLSANSIGSLAISALAGICNVLQASTAISTCLLYLHCRGLGRTSILHKDVMAGRVWEVLLSSGFRS